MGWGILDTLLNELRTNYWKIAALAVAVLIACAVLRWVPPAVPVVALGLAVVGVIVVQIIQRLPPF